MNWFWQLAYKRYNRRKPSIRFELVTIGAGTIFAAMYVVAVFLNPSVANTVRLVVTLLVVAVGFAHRRIRVERLKGPDSLYRRAFASKG